MSKQTLPPSALTRILSQDTLHEQTGLEVTPEISALQPGGATDGEITIAVRTASTSAHLPIEQRSDAGRSSLEVSMGASEGSPWNGRAFGHLLRLPHSCTSVGGLPGEAGHSGGRSSLHLRRPLAQAEDDMSMNGQSPKPPSAAPAWQEGTADQQVWLLQHTDDVEAKKSSKAITIDSHSRTDKATQLVVAALYGIINTILTIPTMIAYASVIWKEPLYADHLGQLAKLGFLASGIHQLIFTLYSTLPFAVGQVQDVGLIFLSAMATSVAVICHDAGKDDRETLGTALVVLAISTSIVGALTIIVGKFKLASLVQYVPLPVVGGYLGYVGYFCLAAGISVAANVQVASFVSWEVLWDRQALIKVAPALAATLWMWGTLKYAKSPLALPAVLVAIPVLFHAVRLAAGWSIQELQDAGWVLPGSGQEPFWEIYKMFNIDLSKGLSGIYFPATWQQAPRVLALFFVVAFGSSLDVAAIQADMPEPLDFNAELATVGLSNLVVGLTGAGQTGSYIFSQTIFSMRAGVRSRLMGAIITILEIGLFLIPVSVVQIMPVFYYGALLMVFGIEISLDWLALSRLKLTRAEFTLLWFTFLAIMQAGLEAGIGIGIVVCALYFAFAYARAHVTAFTVVPSRSAAVRGADQRAILEVFGSKMAAVSLSGYIFFGSAVDISGKVVQVATALTAEDTDIGPLVSGNAAVPAQGSLADLHQKAVEALPHAPRFLLLDFRRVTGLDATAARTLGTLRNTLERLGVELVLTHLDSPQTRGLLAAHGVTLTDQPGEGAPGTCHAFESMDRGMEYCEERFLEVAVRMGLCLAQKGRLTLLDILQSHLDEAKAGPYIDITPEQMATQLAPFMSERHLEAGAQLFSEQDPADEVYFILSGVVVIEGSFLRHSAAQQSINAAAGIPSPSANRVYHDGPGNVIGLTDVFLHRLRSYRAFCSQPTTLLVLRRKDMEEMAHQAPQALIKLQNFLLHLASLHERQAYEVLERTSLS